MIHLWGGGYSDLRKGCFGFEEGCFQIWGRWFQFKERVIQIRGEGNSDFRRVILIWGSDSDLSRGWFGFKEGAIWIWGESDLDFRRGDSDLRMGLRFEEGVIQIWRRGDSDLRREWFIFEEGVIQIWGGDDLDLRMGWFRFKERVIWIWGGVIWFEDGVIRISELLIFLFK